MGEGGEGTQLALIQPAGRPRPARREGVAVTRVDPVASVLVDTGLAHLDRPFEYLVPADLDAEVTSLGRQVRDSRVTQERRRAARLAADAGLGPRSGPGVTVVLADSPREVLEDALAADRVMAIPSTGRYHYYAVVHADRDGDWSGTADDDGAPSLLGSRPSVA